MIIKIIIIIILLLLLLPKENLITPLANFHFQGTYLKLFIGFDLKWITEDIYFHPLRM